MTLELISPPSAQLQHLDLLSLQLSAHKAHQEARQRFQQEHGELFFSCAGRWPSCRAGGHTRPHASTMHQPRRGMPAARVRGSCSPCASRIAGGASVDVHRQWEWPSGLEGACLGRNSSPDDRGARRLTLGGVAVEALSAATLHATPAGPLHRAAAETRSKWGGTRVKKLTTAG